MTRLSFNIYLTSNALAAAFFVYLGMPFRSLPGFLALTLIFTLPSWIILYFSFTLMESADYNVWLKWASFIIFLTVTASIPYLLVCGLISEDLFNRGSLMLLHVGESSAFGACLLHSIAIHRFFKKSSNDTN